MSESMNNIALAILDERKWDTGLDFLNMMGSHVPSPYVFHKVIYNIMLEQKNTRVSGLAYAYAEDMLRLISPCFDNGDYYFEALFSGIKRTPFEHIWELLNCCLQGGCSNSATSGITKACDKNCVQLLKFITHILVTEHEQQSMDFQGKEKKNILCRIIWPSTRPDTISINCKLLISIIDRLFEKDDIVEENMFEVLKISQNILSMIVENALFYSGYTVVETVFYSSVKVFQEISQEICRNCQNIFSSQSKLDLFLETLHIAWFKMILCNNILHHLITGQWTQPQNLSLRNIVFSYMLKLQIEHESARWTAKTESTHQSFRLGCKGKLFPIFNPSKLKKMDGGRALSITGRNYCSTLTKSFDDQRTLPVICRTSNECILHISCLYTLLSEYVRFFYLQSFSSQQNSIKISFEDTVQKRILEKHKHKTSTDEISRLYDDLSIMTDFQTLFKEFEHSICKSANCNEAVLEALSFLQLLADTL